MGKNKAKVFISGALLLVSLLTFKVSAHKDTPEYEKVYNSLTANFCTPDTADTIATAYSDAVRSGVDPEIAYGCVERYLVWINQGHTRYAIEYLGKCANKIKGNYDLVTAVAFLNEKQIGRTDEKAEVFARAYADGVRKGFIQTAYRYANSILCGRDPAWADLYARTLEVKIEDGGMTGEEATEYVNLVLNEGCDPAEAAEYVKSKLRSHRGGFDMRHVPRPTPRS
ncbi:MAG: hypothetical protein LBR79_01390 [Oscillospiraceae bacterium]|jgi:hypothetical protein|nr:hypothetical protein [Oscillospiraceae bacterium]